MHQPKKSEVPQRRLTTEELDRAAEITRNAEGHISFERLLAESTKAPQIKVDTRTSERKNPDIAQSPTTDSPTTPTSILANLTGKAQRLFLSFTSSDQAASGSTSAESPINERRPFESPTKLSVTPDKSTKAKQKERDDEESGDDQIDLDEMIRSYVESGLDGKNRRK